jgi:hypothetical protein
MKRKITQFFSWLSRSSRVSSRHNHSLALANLDEMLALMQFFENKFARTTVTYEPGQLLRQIYEEIRTKLRTQPVEEEIASSEETLLKFRHGLRKSNDQSRDFNCLQQAANAQLLFPSDALHADPRQVAIAEQILIHLKTGNIQDAKALIESISLTSVHSWELCHAIGLIAQSEGNLALALQAYDSCMRSTAYVRAMPCPDVTAELMDQILDSFVKKR